jgi:hypothetical protein
MIGAVIEDGVAKPLRALTWYYPSATDLVTIEQSNYDRGTPTFLAMLLNFEKENPEKI